MSRQWLRFWRPSRDGTQSVHRPRSFVPRIENLEGREVPATLIASGLEGAQGSVVGPGGDLYVTEAVAGRLSRVDADTGTVTTVATGLPSGPYAGFAGGAIDVAFHDGIPYVLVTGVAADVGGTDVVGIYRVDGPNSFTVIADLGAWSEANPPVPAFEVPTGWQYALEPFRGGFLVSDGHHNRVLDVRLNGTISQVIAFDNIVPTGMEVRSNTIYVAQAGPVPHLPENGKIVSFRSNSPTASEVASGTRLLVDVEFGHANTLYALSQGIWDGVFPGDPALPHTGAFVRVNADGTFTSLEEGIDRPSSLEFIGNAAYVVTLGGEVWRFDNFESPSFGLRAGSGDGAQPSFGQEDPWGGIVVATLTSGRKDSQSPGDVILVTGRMSGEPSRIDAGSSIKSAVGPRTATLRVTEVAHRGGSLDEVTRLDALSAEVELRELR